MNGNNIALRIVSAVVLIAAIAGIAFFAFQAGVAKGSPVTIEAPSEQVAPAPYPYYGHGFGIGMPFHPFGFGFGCFAPLLALFLLIVVMKSFRILFWGPRWGWRGHHHGHWGRHWENGVPPMFEEWHKRAHGDQESQESTKNKE